MPRAVTHIHDSPVHPEMDLLFHLASENPDIRLSPNLDWDRLLTLSQRHGLMPRLHSLLQDPAHQEDCPQDRREQIERFFFTNAGRNVFLAQELLRIVDLLKAHGIDPLPYRGPVLAIQAYGDVALRLFDDLDILVRQEQIKQAKELLLAEGYHLHIRLSEQQEKAYRRAGWGYVLQSRDGKYSVDLDTGIAPEHFSFSLPHDRLWKTRRTVTCEGREMETLSTENLLLLLCAHGAKHLWERLGWIVDIGRILQIEKDIDWQETWATAEKYGGRRMLGLGLDLARQVTGARLPDAAAAVIEHDPTVNALAGQVLSRLRGHGAPESPAGQIRFHLKARERRRDRFRYGIRLAFTPSYSDWKSTRLPGWLFRLCAVTRPFRLAWKFIASARWRCRSRS